MSRAVVRRQSKNEVLNQLRDARARTDELFGLIHPNALYRRPIAERHRIAFYLGHLEAFDFNMICAGAFGMKSFNAGFDRLFAFGIDPTDGNLPGDSPRDWPGKAEIRNYCRAVRDGVDRCLSHAADYEIFWAAIEHRLMHAETLAYILHWLPTGAKTAGTALGAAGSRAPDPAEVNIPTGEATLGVTPGLPQLFAWDNEFDGHRVTAPAFSIDRYKVTNLQFAEFVRAGGYAERRFWSDAGWEWIRSSEVRHPKFWKRRGSTWYCRSMAGDIPFQPAWPVYVSHAEAEAYARWKRRSLPTEAQFHRAAFSTPDGKERLYPWGDTAPNARFGNFDFTRWDPCAVDAHPAGDSAFGVSGLVGNGWEWTSTIFSPFTGFKPYSFYPGYSANFFDGKHYVLKGGSPRTAAILLRRSFRNWFQPFYPNIYASFRCVEN